MNTQSYVSAARCSANAVVCVVCFTHCRDEDDRLAFVKLKRISVLLDTIAHNNEKLDYIVFKVHRRRLQREGVHFIVLDTPVHQVKSGHAIRVVHFPGGKEKYESFHVRV